MCFGNSITFLWADLPGFKSRVIIMRLYWTLQWGLDNLPYECDNSQVHIMYQCFLNGCWKTLYWQRAWQLFFPSIQIRQLYVRKYWQAYIVTIIYQYPFILLYLFFIFFEGYPFSRLRHCIRIRGLPIQILLCKTVACRTKLRYKASPLRGWDDLNMAFLGKFAHM